MSNLDSHENMQPSSISTRETDPDGEAPPALLGESAAMGTPLPDESVQAGGPPSTADSSVTGSNVTGDGFSRMMSREIEKVRRLIADAGAVATTVPEFIDFERMAHDWENGPRRQGSFAETLLEKAIDKAAVAHQRLRDSGAVRADAVFDQLLSGRCPGPC
jgi:hypothetical protein